MKKTSGSITIFLSLMLMLIASLLFTLLEVARYHALNMATALTSQSVVESMFAEFNVPAYKNYHLLMLDAGGGTGELGFSKLNAKLQQLAQENLNPVASGFGTYCNYLQLNVTDSRIIRYELITDQEAAALSKQIIEVMKKEVVTDILEGAYEKVKGTDQTVEQGELADQYMDHALDQIEKEKEKQASSGNGEGAMASGAASIQGKSRICVLPLVARGSDLQKPLLLSGQQEEAEPAGGKEVENPIEDIKGIQASPLLLQVLSRDQKISAKQISGEDSLLHRTLNVGNFEEEHSLSLTDRVLLEQYFQKYASSYQKERDIPHALKYEQEYLLFGCEKDEENLEKMAGKLVLLREGINFAYLMSDAVKSAEAMTMATELALAMGVPAAAKAIQMGLLAAWAYAESIVELRTLFSGGKIAALKTAESWNLSLAEMTTALLDSNRKAKEAAGGQSYGDYLQAFLLVEDMGKLSLRFASLLEQNLRLYTHYEMTRVDCMVSAAEVSYTYQAGQVFLTPVQIGSISKKGFEFQNTATFQYLLE